MPTYTKPLDYSSPILYIPDDIDVEVFIESASGSAERRLTLSEAERHGYLAVEEGMFNRMEMRCTKALILKTSKLRVYLSAKTNSEKENY